MRRVFDVLVDDHASCFFVVFVDDMFLFFRGFSKTFIRLLDFICTYDSKNRFNQCVWKDSIYNFSCFKDSLGTSIHNLIRYSYAILLMEGILHHLGWLKFL